MYDRKTTKVDNAEMARLYGLRYGYNDPAARMFRQRARRDRIRETCAESRSHPIVGCRRVAVDLVHLDL